MTDPLPAFDAYRNEPVAVIQHVAAWLVAARCSRLIVPLPASENVATLFVPASATARLPV